MFKIFKYKKECEELRDELERKCRLISKMDEFFDSQEKKIASLKAHIKAVSLINACLMDVLTSSQRKEVSKKLRVKEKVPCKRGRKPRKAKEVKVAKPRGRRKNAKTK